MALLQTSVRSAIPCTCELNLAEIAQKVMNNGANAADCKQKRKCLEMDKMFLHDRDGHFDILKRPHQTLRSLNSLFFSFHQKEFEFERGSAFTSSHNAWESCKRLTTFARDVSSGQ
jgi:hypothetical protein